MRPRHHRRDHHANRHARGRELLDRGDPPGWRRGEAKDAKKQLQQGALAYVQFALENVDTFKIMFSGVLEKEKEYPAFVDISHKTFQRVVDVVRACQEAGILRSTPAEMMAVAVWGQVHGIVSLALEGQISHSVLDHHAIQDLVSFAVEQMISS